MGGRGGGDGGCSSAAIPVLGYRAMAREDLPPAGIRPEAPFAARFSISTDWLPERDRLPFYREELSKVLNVDVTPLGERAPRHAMSHVSAGPIGLGRLLGSPTRYLRTRSHLNDSDVNHLLEETRQTFSEHVVEHRLRRAWRLLADPNCRLKVASIAFEAGFNDLSHFNRSFRRRFGETPTSVRGGSKSFEFRGSVRPTALSSELAED